MKKKYLMIAYAGWCWCGFYRGVKYYNYTYNKYKINTPYLYSTSIIDGIIGLFFYANPLLFPILIHKELYRLEVNIRNLENEKNSEYYNFLI